MDDVESIRTEFTESTEPDTGAFTLPETETEQDSDTDTLAAEENGNDGDAFEDNEE